MRVVLGLGELAWANEVANTVMKDCSESGLEQWLADLTSSAVGRPAWLTIPQVGVSTPSTVISPRQSDDMHGCGSGDPAGIN